MKTLIFDLDGTLIDSRLRHFIVLKEALSFYNIEYISWLEYNMFMDFKRSGKSTKDFLRRFEKINMDKIELVNNYWISKIEDDEFLKYDILYEDTIRILSKIHEKYEIVFLTSRNNRRGLINELHRLDIARYANSINVVSSPNAFEKKKAVIQKYDKGNTLIIGDTEMEYNAALDLGMDFYILNRGFRSKTFWISNSVVSYDSLECLTPYIEKE